MKKNRFSMIALVAILMAVGGAFATKMNVAAAAVSEPSLYWFTGSGTVYHTQNTKTAEGNLTGCKSTMAECERGYTKLQLNDQNNPNAGVQTAQIGTPTDYVRKNTN